METTEREEIINELQDLSTEDLKRLLSLLHSAKKRAKTRISSQEFMDEWNRFNASLPDIKTMSADRVKHLAARSSEPFFVENWKQGIHRITCSHFCLGKNDRGWKADVDWFLRPGTLAKIMEGKYDDRLPVILDSIKPKRRNSVTNTKTIEEHNREWLAEQEEINIGEPLF